jgi:integrase
MLTEEYAEKDGRRVWLDRGEVEMLRDQMDGPRQRCAVRLGAECGLRSHEICAVEPDHLFVDEVAGPMLRVPDGKGGEPRETVMPESLRVLVRALGDGSPDEPVVGAAPRTLRHWIQGARERLAEADDERWRYVTSHDLRRSWAGALANADVDETVALRMGGWADLETFLDHYRGEATPQALSRERAKVGWL